MGKVGCLVVAGAERQDLHVPQTLVPFPKIIFNIIRIFRVCVGFDGINVPSLTSIILFIENFFFSIINNKMDLCTFHFSLFLIICLGFDGFILHKVLLLL